MKKRSTLSALWIFLVVNFIFCDVFTLMYSEELKQILSGKMGSMFIDQPFLLAFAVIMEIPMIMIIASRLLPYKPNRLLNIAVAVLLILVQAGSLFAGKATMHYLFFSTVEIATLVGILWFAVKWKNSVSEQDKKS